MRNYNAYEKNWMDLIEWAMFMGKSKREINTQNLLDEINHIQDKRISEIDLIIANAKK